MSGQTRLFRRGATYYHRAKIPADIRATYPKTEETFSLQTKDYDEAIRLVRIAAVKVDEKFEAHRSSLEGNTKSVSQKLLPVIPTLEPQNKRSPILSKVRDEWFKVKAIEGAWTKRTTDQNRTWTDRFITIVGDRPIDQYTKADGRRFRDIVSGLPSNIDKYKALKQLQIKSIPKKAQSLRLKPMSKANVNKYVIGVSALWKWISKNYDEEPSNPLDGMVYKIKSNPRKEREPFTADELNALFQAPVFTGCKSYKQWNKPGDLFLNESYRYWIPLIALFTGMRLGEICQLYVEDIREEEGITFFDIHASREGMSLKTPHSERQIPVHSELVRLGFMEYVDKLKASAHKRLFPDLKISSEGYYSKNASMHFQRFLKVVGVKHEKNSFHSFRHSFEDACRNSGVSKEIMDTLQGHKEKGMSARYGSGFRLPMLDNAIQKVRYNELSLCHLHSNGS